MHTARDLALGGYSSKHDHSMFHLMQYVGLELGY